MQKSGQWVVVVVVGAGRAGGWIQGSLVERDCHLAMRDSENVVTAFCELSDIVC